MVYRHVSSGAAICAASMLLVFLSIPAAGAAETVVYSFFGDENGSDDGSNPVANLYADAAGTLYGTTIYGGANRNCTGGCGTVFRVTPGGRETILHSFNGSDGRNPHAGLIADANGNFYGTTTYGGAYDNGTVFKLTQKGKESVLYSFTGGNDGALPVGLTMDDGGTLYGTTEMGGAQGYGAVFKLTRRGKQTVLYSLGGGSDGGSPQAGPILDAAGNLYGTAYRGGTYNFGTVFKLTSGGGYTVLHSFTGGSDGSYPYASLTEDGAGNFYGTASFGGPTDSSCPSGCGTVFKLTTGGQFTRLYGFAGGSDGGFPYGSLVLDAAGNLYGTTYADGGATPERRSVNCSSSGCGTVFKLTPDGQESVLHAFTGGNDGANPYSGLVFGAKGKLYGTTDGGGAPCENGCGTVFKLKT